MPQETDFAIRLSKAAKELNVGKDTIVEFLAKKGFQIDSLPNTKLTAEMYALLIKEFQGEKAVKNLAKRFGNFSYKGGSVSVESTIVKKGDIASFAKPLNEKNNGEKEIPIRLKLRDLHFGVNIISIKIGSTEFFLHETGISPNLNSKKNKTYLNDISIKTFLNFSNQTFKFQDPSVLSYLKGLSNRLEKKPNQRLSVKIPFSALTFGQGIVSISYKKKHFENRDPNIKDYDKTIGLIYSKISETSKNATEAIAKKNAISNSLIEIIIHVGTNRFTFKDIDIHRYVNRLMEIYLPENKAVESGNRIQEKEEKKIVTELANEQSKDEKEVKVLLSHLNFGANYISLKLKSLEFILWKTGLSPYLNSEKSIKNTSTVIFLDYSNQTFQFIDPSVLSYLKDLSAKLENEKRKEKKEKRKITKVEHKLPFSELKFGQGLISITYKGKCYIYKDPKIRNYDKILNQVYSKLSKTRRRPINSTIVKVVIDTETETFTFNDIDICNYVNYLMNSFLTEKQVEALKENPLKSKSVPQMPSSALKTMTLEAGNIRFYNGYYLIFQTNKGEIDNTVTPYRVNDPNSHEILNLVHKYFEQIFEQKRIIVKIDETKIIEPSRLDLFQLSNYVRELQRNLDEKKVWWEEVQNARKRSFVQCFGEPTESVKKRVSKSKNEFLYNLSSLQNEKKLIRVYEINHGKEEDAFIFTISMSNNRCAIVFENASKDASTTTWIFVAKDEDYEPCINLVFDYFTDYTVVKKRSSLREKTVTVNPPEKFKAESYAFIYHDDIGRWLKKLNKIIGQTPESSEIQFVPGLHIPESLETRTGHNEAITTRNLHNELMRKLYDKLCGESGKDNVGTEIRVGSKRIDTVVKGKEIFDIYEIKTATNPFDCVTEALGQLCQYAYLYCPDRIGKLVIVGPSETTKEVEQYLSTLRKNHSLQLYYMKV
jgi:hypothetical protein